MKSIQRNSTTALVLCFGLSGCFGLPTVSEQATVLNTRCDLKDIEITDEVIDLNNDQNWIAKCDGKIYRCTYHDTAGSYCTEITE